MKRFFKLTLIIGITMIALAISNIAYADDDFDILTPTDLPTESTSTTAPTTPSTSTTLEIPKTITKTTNTSLPHTGIEDSTGTIVAIVALAIVGISSFVVIKKNSDI